MISTDARRRTSNEAIEMLAELLECTDDPEACHAAADFVILQTVRPDVCSAYLRLAEACSWWGHAEHKGETDDQ